MTTVKDVVHEFNNHILCSYIRSMRDLMCSLFGTMLIACPIVCFNKELEIILAILPTFTIVLALGTIFVNKNILFSQRALDALHGDYGKWYMDIDFIQYCLKLQTLFGVALFFRILYH